MEPMMAVINGLSGVNVILLALLLTIYGRSAARTPSMFTYGLLLFATLFLVHNALALYFAWTMMPLYGTGLGGYILVFTALQTVAFSILNVITWR